jgi:putative ABC transport system permease protein
MERAYVQYVSGSMFSSFGLRPALGRLLTNSDDLKPHGHPYAVLSYNYWKHRFGEDPKVVGRTFRLGNDLYEIVGVGPEGFTGTEPGTMVDIFIPTMMHAGVTRRDWTWMRVLAHVRPGVALEPLRAKLGATSRAFEQERAKGFTNMTKQELDELVNLKMVLEPAATGDSDMQGEYRTSLAAIGVLVALILLIACANVANLMAAQARARGREIALRVAIGAGRRRLVQLVLIESALLASLAAALGALFARWSAPLVVGMINPPDDPARLALPADWRVVAFGLAVTVGVMLLLGLAPALRASSVRPVSALKGGENPHSRRRLMRALVGIQTAFCFLVLFVAGLFVATFERLSNRPTGFSADQVLTLQTVARQPQSTVHWMQVMDHLRQLPGVERAALASAPLMGGWSWNNSISVDGAAPNGVLAYFLSVSPGWIKTMKVPLIAGRDFLPTDTYPGEALINQTFARDFFNGEDAVGKAFDMVTAQDGRFHFNVVGIVGDVCYHNVREPFLPQAYYPFSSLNTKGALGATGKTQGTFVVRTASANPMAIAPALRREVTRAWPEFRVSNVRTQMEIDQSQTVRERLLARLAFFFGVVALLLAGVGLYGVLDYSVLQRRREMAIRMALGAGATEVAWQVTADVFSTVLCGSLAGLALGLGSVRYIESPLYQVRPGDPSMLAMPAVTILAAALVAALPPVLRAVRIDPAATLRAE